MQPDKDAIHARGAALEDAFFHEVDRKLIERLRAEAAQQRDCEELARQTGLSDETLLKELTSLGVTAESILAIRLVPLVLVAWSDRRVPDQERAAVLNEAHRLGVAENSVPGLLLENWLNNPPRKDLEDAWKRYSREVMQQMSAAGQHHFRQELEREMTAVANATGGFLGFNKISDPERATIDRLVQAISSPN